MTSSIRTFKTHLHRSTSAYFDTFCISKAHFVRLGVIRTKVWCSFDEFGQHHTQCVFIARCIQLKSRMLFHAFGCSVVNELSSRAYLFLKIRERRIPAVVRELTSLFFIDPHLGH